MINSFIYGYDMFVSTVSLAFLESLVLLIDECPSFKSNKGQKMYSITFNVLTFYIIVCFKCNSFGERKKEENM